jgi:hypothetical protein
MEPLQWAKTRDRGEFYRLPDTMRRRNGSGKNESDACSAADDRSLPSPSFT